MTQVHLDFETRSALDLKSVGAYAYARHASTDILCAAFSVGAGAIKLLTRAELTEGAHCEDWLINHERWAKLFQLAQDENVIFNAHNAFFEQSIWRALMVEKYGFPEIPIHRWRCTAAMAAAQSLPRSLDGCASVLELKTQKDLEGKKVMMKLSRPRRSSKANPDPYWEPETAWEDFKTLYRYCINDVAVEREIAHILPPLSDSEQEIWELDQAINFRGIEVDVPLIEKTINSAEITKANLRLEFQFLTEGAVEAPTQVQKFREHLETLGVSLPDLQKDTILKALNKPMDETPRRLLEIRQALSKTSLAKFPKMLEAADEDNRITDNLLYHAAHTARWAGKGVQLQNLVRPKYDTDTLASILEFDDYDLFSYLYPDCMSAYSSAIRAMLRAAEGMDLIAGDFSAIEARGSAWVAGQENLLDAFRSGKDPYSEQASEIYNRVIDRKVHITEGLVGKVSLLALGYQGGINAFATMAATYNLDLNPILPTLNATPDELEKAFSAYKSYHQMVDEPLGQDAGMAADIIKQRWRLSNPAIVDFWYKLERAAIDAVKTGELIDCHPLKLRVVNRAGRACLKIYLPSGRAIIYNDVYVKEVENRWGSMKQTLHHRHQNALTKIWEVTTTYGGKLFENVIQAICRDIMAAAMVRIDKAGYPVVLTIHDEVISEILKTFGSLDEFQMLMETPPDWAVGFPIKADVWRAERYRK